MEMPNGTYLYKWLAYGNGTSNWFNQSVQRSYTINDTISVGDTTKPSWTNLRNFSQNANISFSQSITATDTSGIDEYWLNDTATFIINKTSGLITNNTGLNLVRLYWLNISANDTLGNTEQGIFYINITEISTAPPATTTTAETCRYKKYGYYNKFLPWIRQESCL
jgi:hypothetical protein